MSIKLNDILNFSQEELKNTKIKFNLMFAGNWNPIEIFKNSDMKTLLEGQYWNYSKQKIFKEGDFPEKDNNQYKYIYYTNYIYDDKNRLIEEEECASDLLKGEKVIYIYDEYGNIIEKISFNDKNRQI